MPTIILVNVGISVTRCTACVYIRSANTSRRITSELTSHKQSAAPIAGAAGVRCRPAGIIMDSLTELSIANAAVRHVLDEKLEFLPRQLLAVPFLDQQVDDVVHDGGRRAGGRQAGGGQTATTVRVTVTTLS